MTTSLQRRRHAALEQPSPTRQSRLAALALRSRLRRRALPTLRTRTRPPHRRRWGRQRRVTRRCETNGPPQQLAGNHAWPPPPPPLRREPRDPSSPNPQCSDRAQSRSREWALRSAWRRGGAGGAGRGPLKVTEFRPVASICTKFIILLNILYKRTSGGPRAPGRRAGSFPQRSQYAASTLKASEFSRGSAQCQVSCGPAVPGH